MPILDVIENFADNTILTQNQLHQAFVSIETFVNITKLGSDNLQSGAVTETQIDNDAITSDKIADGSITMDKLAAEIAMRLMPAGSIIASGSVATPAGYLYCNGLAVSRSVFSALFNAIGEAYGQGDNTTSFNLPDLRGFFLRGQDDGTGNDADAGSRVALQTGGAVGDNVGSYQDEELLSHNHTQNAHAHNIIDPGHSHDYTTYDGFNVNGGRIAGSNSTTPALQPAVNGISPNVTGISINSATATNNPIGGNETRPKNVYIRYYIKT